MMNLKRNKRYITIMKRQYMYNILAFDEYNNLRAEEIVGNGTYLVRICGDNTSQNYKFKPKIYDTLISRSSELLIFRKDTVFQKKQSDTKR
jgi:hypothetical protein